MKKLLITILIGVLAVTAEAQRKQLLILHTNDTHSCIEPLNPRLADKNIAGKGGFVRRLNVLAEERRTHPDLLLFDSGDFSQGSPYYTLYRGDVEVELMNRMRYDAVTIGNHEFDFGIENMARLFKNATFPVVCSNYDFTDTPLKGLVKPWLIIRRNGLKVGVFGLSPDPKGLIDVDKSRGLKFLDPIETANRVATFLKVRKRCDIVVCLSHLGWDSPDINDTILIRQSRNIDLVLGGHSHTMMKTLGVVPNIDGKQVFVDQNGKQGLKIGRLLLDFKKK